MSSRTLHPGTFIGGPLAQNTFAFNPELPAYNILNARVGFLNGRWDVAFFVDNLTDERAFLALDQKRGTLARGRLSDEPATELRHQHAHRLLMSSPNRLAKDLHAGSMRRRRNGGHAGSDNAPSVNLEPLAGMGL